MWKLTDSGSIFTRKLNTYQHASAEISIKWFLTDACDWVIITQLNKRLPEQVFVNNYSGFYLIFSPPVQFNYWSLHGRLRLTYNDTMASGASLQPAEAYLSLYSSGPQYWGAGCALPYAYQRTQPSCAFWRKYKSVALRPFFSDLCVFTVHLSFTGKTSNLPSRSMLIQLLAAESCTNTEIKMKNKRTKKAAATPKVPANQSIVEMEFEKHAVTFRDLWCT